MVLICLVQEDGALSMQYCYGIFNRKISIKLYFNQLFILTNFQEWEFEIQFAKKIFQNIHKYLIIISIPFEMKNNNKNTNIFIESIFSEKKKSKHNSVHFVEIGALKNGRFQANKILKH